MRQITGVIFKKNILCKKQILSIYCFLLLTIAKLLPLQKMKKIITVTFSILLLLSFNNVRASELSAQISEEYKAGNISYHQYLVHRGYMLFDTAKLQSIYPGYTNQQAIKSGTGIIMELNANWNILTSEEKSFFAKQMARPVLQNSIISPAGGFKVHFDTTGVNSVPLKDSTNSGIPDYVEIAASALDTSLYIYVNELKYKIPISDEDEEIGRASCRERV